MGDDQDNTGKHDQSPGLVGATLRIASLCVLWVVLVRGQVVESWYIGLPTVAAGTYASFRLVPHAGQRIRLWGLIRFVPYFLCESVVGAVDVARRAFRPSMPLAPGMVHYQLRMPSDEVAAVFFVGIISLLPGTLCAVLDEDGVEVHVVDRTQPVEEQLAELEAVVAGVFGVPLDGRTTEDGDR